jgi:Kef-type K+ transport system membrane component KefB
MPGLDGPATLAELPAIDPGVRCVFMTGHPTSTAPATWGSRGPTIQVLAIFGLAFLCFLAGFESDFPALRGRPIMLAALGWITSLIVCLGVGFKAVMDKALRM